MLSRERYELTVGIVFIVALSLLVSGLLWGKRFRPNQAEMELAALFTTVGGLGKGDEVLVSGMRLGKVKTIRLRPRDVMVELTLERDIPLYTGYRIRVTTLNFTGEMGVTIDPGEGEPLAEPYGILHGTAPLSLDEIVKPGIETLHSVRNVADTLATSLPPMIHSTREILARLDRTLAEVESGVALNKVALQQSLVQLRSSLSSADRVITSLDSKLSTTLTNADGAIVSFKAASDSLKHAAAVITDAKGTINSLVHDPALYDDLRRVSSHLDSAALSMDSLVRDVQQNPKRYVRFSLF